MSRTILHVDMNSCYASIELLYHPELRGKPVTVAGDVEQRHGIILTRTPEAKALGVKTGDAIWQAMQKCPELTVLPPNFSLYLRYSRYANNLYRQYTPLVQPFGIDESWLDVSGCEGLFGDGRQIAETIRKRMHNELGVTVSVGVSWNKVFAKLGSDYKKPNAVTAFDQSNFRDLVWPLPASDLLYVGRATEAKLRRYGIRTIGELAQASPDILHQLLGKWGLMLHDFANGEDASPVSEWGDVSPIKSIGNSTTLPRDITTKEDARAVFYMLGESVASRLREQGMRASLVTISLRSTQLEWQSHQKPTLRATCSAKELVASAMELLSIHWDGKHPLRSLGLSAGKLIPADAPRQTGLYFDDEQCARLETLEAAADRVRDRFGPFSLRRGILLQDRALTAESPKEDHVIHPHSFWL